MLLGKVESATVNAIGIITPPVNPFFLGLEIGLRGRTAPIDFHLLAELAGQMEIVARWKKQPQAVPTILKFVEVLQQEVKLAFGVSE